MINAEILIAKLMCFLFTQKCSLLPSALAQHAFKLCLVKFLDARCRMGEGSISETYVNLVPAINCLVRVDPKILFPERSNREIKHETWNLISTNIKYLHSSSICLKKLPIFFQLMQKKRVFLGPFIWTPAINLQLNELCLISSSFVSLTEIEGDLGVSSNVKV